MTTKILKRALELACEPQVQNDCPTPIVKSGPCKDCDPISYEDCVKRIADYYIKKARRELCKKK